ncbi:hypothetical protein SAMN04515695_6149 [Pseudovibrio sp. Tun.PSC04-5.I4]|nr:hypothetical protein SAMN04515695_6149 [Pseudovibrio sp. Tun.PSC04-5.I4]
MPYWVFLVAYLRLVARSDLIVTISSNKAKASCRLLLIHNTHTPMVVLLTKYVDCVYVNR